jgi:mRNA interferase MazF
MAMVIERFNIFLVQLDPATGAETAKTRPCLVVSPDELNRAVSTVIIAPMTTVQRGWPTRVAVTFQGKTGEIALDQIRAVDKVRLVKRLGKLDAAIADAVLDTLGEMFAP